MKTYQLSALLIALALAACGDKTPGKADASAVASAAAPAHEAAHVAAPAPAAAAAAAPAPAASAADLVVGEKVYTATCLSCHGAGVLGAPKFGDAAAWQPRVAKGMEVLYTSALNGFKMMPPRGGNSVLKDEEMKAAVDYMVSKAH
ncbi:c-type cytochrome [Janthinobacterium sp.]|uniref:c-type cytochrome n=1 Tax=Janthinobacterium sp. TaxID=1871054 RepID=UPI00293D4FC6|nr:c-type cytochrome [Janthinobacterium sp.]